MPEEPKDQGNGLNNIGDVNQSQPQVEPDLQVSDNIEKDIQDQLNRVDGIDPEDTTQVLPVASSSGVVQVTEPIETPEGTPSVFVAPNLNTSESVIGMDSQTKVEEDATIAPEVPVNQASVPSDTNVQPTPPTIANNTAIASNPVVAEIPKPRFSKKMIILIVAGAVVLIGGIGALVAFYLY